MNLELHVSAVERIAGSVPDIPIEYEQILKDRGGSWNDVNRSYLPEDSVLTARREETAWALADGVHEIVPMQECVDTGRKQLCTDQDRHRQTCGSCFGQDSMDSFFRGLQDSETKENSTCVASISTILSNDTL